MNLLSDFTFTGVVLHGEKRGRKMGFPTANINLMHIQANSLNKGIYAVWVKVEGTNTWYKGAASYGYNPTFGMDEPLFEVHILGFNADIYGKSITVVVSNFIREELKFENLETLIMQIKSDCETAQKLLTKEPSL